MGAGLLSYIQKILVDLVGGNLPLYSYHKAHHLLQVYIPGIHASQTVAGC